MECSHFPARGEAAAPAPPSVPLAVRELATPPFLIKRMHKPLAERQLRAASPLRGTLVGTLTENVAIRTAVSSSCFIRRTWWRAVQTSEVAAIELQPNMSPPISCVVSARQTLTKTGQQGEKLNNEGCLRFEFHDGYSAPSASTGPSIARLQHRRSIIWKPELVRSKEGKKG